MTMQRWDAEALYADLLAQVGASIDRTTLIVGIWTGGAWLAERLRRDLNRDDEMGVISSTLHRDDFGQRGLSAASDSTRLPWAIDGRDMLLVDDVLHSGRTVRAVVNELFDFGRPASVKLAVLVDRGGRQLPIDAAIAAVRVQLPEETRLRLARDEAGRFSFSVDEVQPEKGRR